MLRHTICVALLFVAALPAFSEVKLGEPPPEIQLDALLPDQPPANATLRALAGKAVVLEFWATWCQPCVAEIPHLNDLGSRFKDRPIVFLSVTDEEQPTVEAFLHEHPMGGWIGIAHSTHLKHAYGVNGIPQAFLIDAKGKLAGAIHPSRLTAATLEGLLAGRPVPFEPVPFHVAAPVALQFSTQRSGKSLLEILVQPNSNPSGKSRMLILPGNLRIEGSTLRRIVSWSHEFWQESRIEGDPDFLSATYDLAITMPIANVKEPTANVQRLRAMVRGIIPAAFGVKVSRQTRETDVYVLTAPNGKPAALVAPAEEGTPETGGGKLELPRFDFAQMPFILEDLLHRPVVDETGISGEYGLKLAYDANAPGALIDALKRAGLNVNRARRPIEFLVVTKAQ